MRWAIKGPKTTPIRTTANRDRVGVVSRMRYETLANRAAAFADLQARGIAHTRDDWRWEETELIKGTFTWGPTDAVMTLAAQHGVTVLPALCYSAKWAATGPTKFHPPRDPADFARYCTALVSRYGRGGAFWAENPDLTPRPVVAAMIWNEPWLYRYWEPDPSPSGYAALVRAAAGALHAVDPQFEVLMCADIRYVNRNGTTGNWIRSVLDADPTIDRVINGYFLHLYPAGFKTGPYEESVPLSSFARVLLARDDILYQGKRDLPFWITEVGWSTAATHVNSVSEATAATYTEGALVRAVQEWPFVKRIYIHMYTRSFGTGNDFWGHIGLLRSDGTPKPALERMTSYLGG